ncbi:hypothetical protein ACWT_2668 [Actinoplanes sp. SE50]|nr:hypothetical protein ACPL_2878 [Actinoplanes sp. SE50/110]ATO82083.1 hypothetical protein ACWT_2668 [Actinoplanes sp. SE50]SLL99490.1 hypothetical protein ACSP50_2721 [Actinoplanes sp. SE50/110]
MLLKPGSPRWRDHLGPAVVILIGVLLVVAVGVVAKLSHGDHPAADPVTGAVVEPTVEQVPIPLPSPSITESAPPVNAISVEEGSIPDTVDLSAEGTIDWVHWGEDGTYSLERSSSGGFAILEGTPDAPRRRHTLSPQRYVWSGGTPAPKNAGATSGVRTCGTGNGFTLSAPATPDQRTLRLYLGVAGATGTLRLKLTTGGETYTSALTRKAATLATTRYTINYRSTGPGKISVEWITGKTFDPDCGGVALEAATLH